LRKKSHIYLEDEFLEEVARIKLDSTTFSTPCLRFSQIWLIPLLDDDPPIFNKTGKAAAAFSLLAKFHPVSPVGGKTKKEKKKKRICEITIVFKTIGLASNSNKFLTFSLTCSQIWLSLLLWRIASVCRWDEQQAVLERQSDLLLLLLLLLLPILSQGFVVFNFVKLVDW
jgi:hypothetical protein